MREEKRIAVAFRGMAQSGIPGASAVVGMVPGDGMIGAHVAAFIGRFIQSHEHMDVWARIGSKIVPLIGTRPESWKHGG